MPPLNDPSRTALKLITTGAVGLVWAAVALVYIFRNHPDWQWPYYFTAGLVASAAVVLLVGVFFGPIGREARNANSPAEPGRRGA